MSEYIHNKEIGYSVRAKLNALKKDVDSKATQQDIDKLRTPYYETKAQLEADRPDAAEGSKAWVGAPYPGTVWVVKDGKWQNTGVIPPAEEVDLAQYTPKDIVAKFQDVMPSSSVYFPKNLTLLENPIQGIFGKNQPITDNIPLYTGGGYSTYTFIYIADTPNNYTPVNIYCRNVKGANNYYRSVLITDENGNEVFKTNRSGDMSFQLYHNYTIQVTVDQNTGSVGHSAVAPLSLTGKLENLDNDIKNVNNSISFQELLSNPDLLYSRQYIDSWQTDSVKTNETKKHLNNDVKGSTIKIGQCTPEASGTNANIWGYNIAIPNETELKKKGEFIYVLFTIYSEKETDSLSAGLYFSNGNGIIRDSNLGYMEKGWNVKYAKIELTKDAIANEQRFLLFSRSSTNNKDFFANSTIFASYPIVSYYNISYLDVNILNLISRIKTVETKTDLLSTLAICLGDSLTAGAGGDKTYMKDKVLEKFIEENIDVSTLQGSVTYPLVMQAILGSKYNVVNMGVGGENIRTIAARQGAAPALLPYDITLPATTTTVEIANGANFLKSSFDGLAVTPLLQGAGNSVNPCYVEGIECTLSQTSGTYYLKRNVAGRETKILKDTQILMYGSKALRNTKLAVIWCWQNGGYTNNDDLIEKLDKIISNIGTTNYILVGLHTGTEASRSDQESALNSKYGNRYFNWRKYVSSNALYDFGITPTTDADLTADQLANGAKSDEYQMSIGSFPSSLWRAMYGRDGETTNDSTHGNAALYMILGYKLIECFKLIGAIG